MTTTGPAPAARGIGARIWAHDTTLWTTDPDGAAEAAQRLGWLELPTSMRAHLPHLRGFARAARADGITRAVVLGMGGSSLCVEVLAATLGPGGTLRPPGADGVPVRVLDSTHPAALADTLAWAPPATSLYVVASKSGTTTEPNDFAAFFEAEAAKALGEDAGSHFVAITDPDTPLAAHARDHGYREVFTNPPDIGGRYSALSLFGLVPAALLGVDLEALLDRAAAMAAACGPDVADADSPGVQLGRFLADQATAGRDKVTVLTGQALDSFGLWVEQLLAESTGKQGRGLLPVVGEGGAGTVDAYGPDRAVVGVARGHFSPALFHDVTDGDHPWFRVSLDDGLDLGAEFFRWEFATAVAGHLLGINAFDQPDVQAAKDATKRVLAEVTGGDPDAAGPDPLAGVTGTVRLAGAADAATAGEALRAWLDGVKPPAYVALLAYVDPSAGNLDDLRWMAWMIQRHTHAATTVGLGPRYLHSTGQLHKGGADGGRYLVITDTPQPGLDVPGRGYSFATLVGAQAAGDLAALRDRGRDVLHVHLTDGADLAALKDPLRVALGSGAEEA